MGWSVARARAGIYGSVAAAVLLLAGLFPASTAAATTLTFVPIADTQVASGNVNGNYGSLATIRTRQGDGTSTNPIYRSYLTFQISGATGANVSSVTLQLHRAVSPHLRSADRCERQQPRGRGGDRPQCCGRRRPRNRDLCGRRSARADAARGLSGDASHPHAAGRDVGRPHERFAPGGLIRVGKSFAVRRPPGSGLVDAIGSLCRRQDRQANATAKSGGGGVSIGEQRTRTVRVGLH